MGADSVVGGRLCIAMVPRNKPYHLLRPVSGQMRTCFLLTVWSLDVDAKQVLYCREGMPALLVPVFGEHAASCLCAYCCVSL